MIAFLLLLLLLLFYCFYVFSCEVEFSSVVVKRSFVYCRAIYFQFIYKQSSGYTRSFNHSFVGWFVRTYRTIRSCFVLFKLFVVHSSLVHRWPSSQFNLRVLRSSSLSITTESNIN